MNLTDAQVNMKEATEMSAAIAKAASEKVYHTFIGLGVDFNTQIVELVSNHPGSTYMSVESSAEFHKTMKDEFDYMMFPCAFNIEIELKSDNFTVERVFGSPGNSVPKKANTILINSIYPSAKETPTSTKGGVVLAKLKPNNASITAITEVNATLKYVDWQGKATSSSQIVKIANNESYSNSAVRKAILLTRYVHLMKHYLHDYHKSITVPSVNKTTGLTIPSFAPEDGAEGGAGAGAGAGGSVVGSVIKSVTQKNETSYLELIQFFASYFETEQEKISDTDLTKVQEKLSQIMEMIVKARKEETKQ